MNFCVVQRALEFSESLLFSDDQLKDSTRSHKWRSHTFNRISTKQITFYKTENLIQIPVVFSSSSLISIKRHLGSVLDHKILTRRFSS